ncbi:hypothetical protein NADFUDRAFT_49913 [Nadsonia fulvescens var. elongata DSM 6958]|uniref:DUF1751-domain-containing protein n=1 Tax=Nadsonia fulvescens var. elongata DSM 6958 TaxID=857566 RepID=A0A1E3PQG6_9ASCO|nr:hypothetical protein NADFUDRAFT_49913 [Nadsonia fulvescens var. elongata DSM 6958]
MIRITVPPITRAILLAVLLLSIINSYLRYATYSSLYRQFYLYELSPASFEGKPPVAPEWSQIVVPFLTIAPHITSWALYPIALLTSLFIETSLHGLIVSVLIITLASSYIERNWNDTTQYLRFVVFSCLGSYIVTTLITLFLYPTNPTQASLTRPAFVRVIHGSIPLQMALLVALTQIIPQHKIVLFNLDVLKFRVKHTPLALFMLYAFMDLLGIDSNEGTVLLAWNGLFFGWFYLRFLRSINDTDNGASPNSLPVFDVPQTTSATVGDASETFAFSHLFFPASVRSVVDTGALTIASILGQGLKFAPAGLISRLPASVITVLALDGNSTVANVNNVSASAPTLTDDEAERRRALALKVLEQRLAGQT